VHVFVVHLSPNNMLGYPLDQFVSLAAERNASRLAETARLRDLAGELAEPVLLLCDCNLTDTSQAYTRLDSALQDSFAEAGWGFGHTLQNQASGFRIQRLDYVWHDESFAAVEAHVGPEGGSDHLPVTAKLVLKNGQ
jgi:endonuclease/exonuclease/phosphatase (EEP) superfamily protein YafD